MCHHRLPIGIQTFSKLREGGFIYVDKTAFIEPLVKGGGYYFLSRPRRFGKSLFLSTLQSYFEGRRDLFKGLALDSADVDWTPSPVLHFDFNSGTFDDEESLIEILDSYLARYESQYGMERGEKSRTAIPVRFGNLLRGVFKQTGRKVVILIDEYDKPLLGIEEEKEKFERTQSLLKGFYGNLKSMDAFIRFAFISGVARFNKVSIFSDVNNLNDISLHNRYADICGWTEEELIDCFREEISRMAKEEGVKFSTLLPQLRSYYDGYLFAPKGHRLYNPFSVLKAFDEERLGMYWFSTGTPTFLVRRIRKKGIDPSQLNGYQEKADNLLAVDSVRGNPVALMFQTGYLTIGSYDSQRSIYELRFPNYEVEHGFARYLLPMYVPDSVGCKEIFSVLEFENDLYQGRPEDFLKRLDSLLKDLPYEDRRESTYRGIVYSLCALCTTRPQAERHSYRGRSDLEVFTDKYLYIFEFKYNRSAGDALAQIRERDYAGRHALDPRTLYLIGVNFVTDGAESALTYEILRQ